MANPKFCYGENVQIIGGFYRGQKGRVYSVMKNWGFFGTLMYRLEGIPVGRLEVSESDLRSLDHPNKEFDDKLQKLIK